MDCSAEVMRSEEDQDLESFLNELIELDGDLFEESDQENEVMRSEEDQDLESFLNELIELDGDLFEESDQENDESSDQLLQAAKNSSESRNENQQQQQTSQALIDSSEKSLDVTDVEKERTFTAQDEVAEIKSMTVSEIVKVQSDLYGITNGMSNMGIRDKSLDLKRLEDEIAMISPEQTAAYSRAMIECPGLVSDERKLAFLDAEDGDPALAAARLVFYWKFRLDLFGAKRCFLTMTLNGAIGDEVKNMVERRIVQLLPVKDAAGRAILYFVPSRRCYSEYTAEQEIMAVWYLLEVAMEEVQSHGVVYVIDSRNVEQEPKYFMPKYMSLLRQIDAALPLRCCANHICYPSFFANFVLVPMGKVLSGRDFRRRVKIHYGSTAEVLASLEGFCLPSDRLPADIGGDIPLDMAKWVSERRGLEESRPDPRLVSDQHPMILPEAPPGSDVTMPIAEEAVHTEGKKKGRKSDPRMTRAIEAKLADNKLSLPDALKKGGFVFDRINRVGNIVDANNITLVQRQNQLSRRIRLIKKAKLEQFQQRKAKYKSPGAQGDFRTSSSTCSSSSSSLPCTPVSPPTTGNT